MKEEELKNRIRKRFFSEYDAEAELGNIDFAVAERLPEDAILSRDRHWYLWAEFKQSARTDALESFTQLVLTIGKERTHERELPPPWLGAIDGGKVVFIPYNVVLPVFTEDKHINWNITPSNHNTEEFKRVQGILKDLGIEKEFHVFSFAHDEKELSHFIKVHFSIGRLGTAKKSITKNNFVSIYLRWRQEVLPSIALNWKGSDLSEADFFLADVMSIKNKTIRDKLQVLLNDDRYKINRHQNLSGEFNFGEVEFRKGGLEKHRAFWNKYKRPPKDEYQEYILTRRDLLVPQNIRERKGSYFTPQIWVEKSQEYIAATLGENWQDEYYVWDCCGGTANMEVGLQNPSRVWMSTIDEADVRVVKENIANNTLPSLYASHVFQFDFLNGDFKDLPPELLHIIETPELRRKLIIYINPPYAEAATTKTKTGGGEAKAGLSASKIREKYFDEMGRAVNEMFAQFYVRIVREISGCYLAVFSKLKILQGPNYVEFRKRFPAQLKSIFIVPSFTFDNVKGVFPIGFQIYDTAILEEFTEAMADVYDSGNNQLPSKLITSYKGKRYIVDWFRKYYDKENPHLAYLRFLGTDFQHNNDIFLTLKPYENDLKQVKGTWITKKNLAVSMVYFAVRRCLAKDWMNDRDQFLSPSEGWEMDLEFMSDCLVFSLFNAQNRISSQHGVNNWIPYTEDEVGARHAFKSHFLTEYMVGHIEVGEKIVIDENDPFSQGKTIPIMSPKIQFSVEAQRVMDAGREVWRYYHSVPDATPDASLYDIKDYFQGRDKGGKMNPSSEDPDYTERMDNLKAAEKALGEKIAEKVYLYGFLIR